MTVREPGSSRHSQQRNAAFLLIYAPKRGLLEVKNLAVAPFHGLYYMSVIMVTTMLLRTHVDLASRERSACRCFQCRQGLSSLVSGLQPVGTEQLDIQICERQNNAVLPTKEWRRTDDRDDTVSPCSQVHIPQLELSSLQSC